MELKENLLGMDHVGIPTADLEKSIAFYESIGFEVALRTAVPDGGKVAFLRLIALPLVVLCIFKYSGLAALVPDGQSILMISLLAASAPAAANVTQIAQVYGHEGDYAGAINVITTLLCIGTMPLMVLLYQM